MFLFSDNVKFALVISIISLQITISLENILNSSRYAKGFLAKYGYRRTWLLRIPAEEYKEMLSLYQRYFGIQETGTLSKETIESMRNPRCGVGDAALKRVTTKHDFVLQGSQWKTKNKLTWKISMLPTKLDSKRIYKTFESSFASWEQQTNIEFVRANKDEAKADIDIRIISGFHQDPFPFDGEGGSLGHAFYPNNEKGLSGDIHLDAEDITNEQTDLTWLVIHLIGHSLGISHNSNRSSIMFPNQNYRKQANISTLSKMDIKAVQALYGSPTAPTTTTINPITSTKLSTTKVHLQSTAITQTINSKSTTYSPTKTENTLKECLSQVNALVYYDFHGRIVIFSKSNIVILINGRGKTYIANQRNLIPKLGDATVDAAIMVVSNGKKYLVLFSGRNYYLYKSRYFQFHSGPHSIHNGDSILKIKLPIIVNKVDAAMNWNADNSIYIFHKEDVWKYSLMNYEQSKPILISEIWPGIPSHIDAAYNRLNKTYFIKNDMLFSWDQKNQSVKKQFPKPWRRELLNCQ